MYKTKLLGLILGLFCAMTVSHADTKHIVGRVERVLIMPGKLELSAKLDTGAETSSIDARNVEKFKKENKTYIRFTVKANKKDITLEAPLVRTVKIVRRHDETSKSKKKFLTRPVIKLGICIGNDFKEVEFNLANRKNFIYPVLLGRSAMETYNLIIDPSIKFTVKPDCNPKSKTPDLLARITH